jgi:16S rRNA (uracil1498-N3)-methyltransferase
MHRIYTPPINISETEIMFPVEQTHRISKVLRLNEGSTVIVFDGIGKEYRVTLKKLKNQVMRGIIESVSGINRDPKLEIILLQGLPKFEKMDLIVQKATELGVKTIIPIITERSIPKLTPQKVKQRVDRWQKIAISAAEQSGRTIIPLIFSIVNFEIGLNEISHCDLKLLFWEEERKITLKSILRDINKPNSIAIVIGPEGGFTKEEVSLAKQFGISSVSLGSRLLRTETASITVLSILHYEFSE